MWRTSKGGGLLENRGQQWNNMEKKSRKMRRERERSGGGARTEMRIEKMPRFWPGICRGMPTEEGGGEGGGHRSPPLLIRQRRFMWTATGCRANERPPSTSGTLPLFPFCFPPRLLLVFFPFPIPITRTQWRGQSWVRTPYGVFLFLFFVVTRRWNIAPGLLIPNDRLLIQHVLRLIPCIVKTQ